MHVVIPQEAKNKELGWKLLEYTCFDYTDTYVQISLDHEFVLPGYKKFYEVDFPFWGSAMSFYGENLRQRAFELFEDAPVNFIPPEYAECEAIFIAELHKMRSGETTPEQMLDKCADEFEALIAVR
ncbi:MAG: hypothetical protein GY847_03445 [Proteobacteria bacterium]|nr:hypothetical protein [Pseudomonadota bacterium]